MKLKVEEYVFNINRIEEERIDTLVSQMNIDVRLGYLEFRGERNPQIYDKFLHIDEIKDDEIILSVYKDDQILRRVFSIHLFDEEIYHAKGPIDLPCGYWYRFRLE